MRKQSFIIIFCLQVIGLGIIFGMLMQSNYLAKASPLFQSTPVPTPEPFLGPIYYGRHDIWNVIDHNLPLARTGEDENNIIMHHNGVTYAATPMPTNGYGYDEHGGIDYSLSYDPVLAGADGTIAVAGWHNPSNHRSGFGLYVQINHGTYSALYGHLSSLVARTGETIITDPTNGAGILGISGNTGSVFGGCSDVGDDPLCGDHLHFEVREGTGYRPIDPYGWITTTVTDPWSIHPDGAISYNLWENPPAIIVGTTDQYPGGTPITAPLLTDPIIEVDDSDPDFFRTESYCWSNSGSYHQTNVINPVPDINDPPEPTCYAEWTFDPEIEAPADDYDVYVHMPDVISKTLHARYIIHHNGQTDEAVVVQAAYPNGAHGEWVYLGRYYFGLNDNDDPDNDWGKDYIWVSNQTINDEAYGTIVVADTIRLHSVNQLPDLEIPITQSNNDAGTHENGCGYNGSSATYKEVYLGYCESSNAGIISGFRYDGVTIPEGATIASARLEFTVDGEYTGTINTQFRGELADDASAFTFGNYPIDRDTLTTSSIPWNVESDDTWYVGNVRTSPDLSTIIQEVIDQPAWHSGNAIVIITERLGSDTSARRVFGWDRYRDSLQTAKLQIWYTQPPPPTPTPAPTATPAPPPVPTGLTAVYHDGLPHLNSLSRSTSSIIRRPMTPVPMDPVAYVYLNWQSNSPPPGTTFTVYRNNTQPVPTDYAHRIAVGLRSPSHRDYSGQLGTWYTVTAVNPNGTSNHSNYAEARLPCPEC